MTINIDLTIEKPENILMFKISDIEKEFVYNYIYNLNSISNINTLCIFMHNGKELNIKKNKDNYLTINEDKVEIKTENSFVNQIGKINIKKLLQDMVTLLYDNDYTNFKVYFVPSEKILSNHRIKKYKFTQQEIEETKNKLNKSITKRKLHLTSNELIVKKKQLKKIPEKTLNSYFLITPEILTNKKNNLKHTCKAKNHFAIKNENFNNALSKAIKHFNVDNHLKEKQLELELKEKQLELELKKTDDKINETTLDTVKEEGVKSVSLTPELLSDQKNKLKKIQINEKKPVDTDYADLCQIEDTNDMNVNYDLAGSNISNKTQENEFNNTEQNSNMVNAIKNIDYDIEDESVLDKETNELGNIITGLTESLTSSQYDEIEKNWDFEQLNTSTVDDLMKSNNSELYSDYF